MKHYYYVGQADPTKIFSAREYSNHGGGVTKGGLKDLPKDHYPYYYTTLEELPKIINKDKI